MLYVMLVLRPSDPDQNLHHPGSPAYRRRIVGPLVLHDHVSQHPILNLVIYVNIYPIGLFLWRTLIHGLNLQVGLESPMPGPEAKL